MDDISQSLENATESNTNAVENQDKTNDQSSTPMSKRQRKKLLKLEQWEEKKKEKRRKEREKERQKRAQGIGRSGPSRKALKRNKVDKEKSKISVAIDLSFDELMSDKDTHKCVKQLLRVYSLNRRAENPLPLYFTSVRPGTKSFNVFEKYDGYKNWDITYKESSYLDAGFSKEKIVYLTAESDNVLQTLEDGTCYVIGGLVDHNQHKGICHKQAEEAGIKTARLPLSEYISMKTRTVLTILHVFEIILRISEGQDWQKTLLKVLPSRKGAVPKGSNTDELVTSNDDNQVTNKCES